MPFYIDDIQTDSNNASLVARDPKESVRVATTVHLAALSGEQTIDGIAVVAGNRVLVKNQNTASANGIYVCASGAWSRSLDADVSEEVTSGCRTYVEEGTANTKTQWVLTTINPIVLGSTSLVFELDTASSLHKAVSGEISGMTEKASPVGDDLLVIEDSAASNTKKRVKISNLPTGSGQQKSSNDFPLTYSTNPYYDSAAGSYTLMRDTVFRGTSAMGTPTSMKVTAWADSGGTCAVRVYDVTNSKVICSNESITNTVKTAIDLGALSNLPTGEAVWEIQIYRKVGSGGIKVYASNFQIYY